MLKPLRAAARRINERIGAETGLRIDRFLVERYIADPVVELFVGVKLDAVCGWAVIVGAGGSGVEAGDVHTLLLGPVSEVEVSADERDHFRSARCSISRHVRT